MSKVSINESTLTAIGNAIREKTGKTALIAPGSMPTEIANIQTGGGGDIEFEPIKLTGNQPYGCAGPIASEYIKMCGDTISTEGLMTVGSMFQYSTLERIPFALNMNNTTYRDMSNMFFQCNNLKEAPVMNNVYPEICGSIFEGCNMLREFPEGFGSDWNWDRLHTYSYSKFSNFFASCYSLRKVPVDILKNMWGTQISASYTPMYNAFSKCYALDEVRDFPIHQAALTSNCFDSIVPSCSRLKSFTFATNEDGTPKIANWKNQTIDITNRYNSNPIGYAYVASNITGYNSGITADKEVKDDATYQALKNDPDWFTCNFKYSRYNHDSAVETINSLPDTSAYGTNTIKFVGGAGELTDGGAINTLTEAEIAVAAAKGWTVTLS